MLHARNPVARLLTIIPLSFALAFTLLAGGALAAPSTHAVPPHLFRRRSFRS